jgi:hypothetical protein
LKGEYFSATPAQICWIADSSELLNVVGSPSVSNAGVVPGA